MRRPMSPNRRKAAALAGFGAAMSGVLPLLHQHQPADFSDLAFATLVGVSIGITFATSIGLIIRDRRACAKA